MNLNPFENENCLELEDRCKDNDWFSVWEYDYDDLIKSITDKVHWKVISGANDYQGDYICFGEGNGKFYLLDFGYGSCSGCDALQACDSYQEVIELRNDLKRNIKEFETMDEFKQWFDIEGQTEWWNWDDIKQFISDMESIYGIKLVWRD